MARRKIGQFALVLGSFLVLSACETPPPAEDGAAARPARAARGGAQDAEAPDVFKVNDKALWDGRFSLGGIWVAHPSVTNPERVMIRNPANGKSVEGALFRRERDLPGPALQVSADAAAALGMLAGQPATLDVVAMRRVEAPAAPEPVPQAAPETKPAAVAAAGATAAAASIETTKLAPEGAAAPAAAKPATTAATRPAARSAAAAEAASEAAAAAPEPAPKKKWWQKKTPAQPVAEPAPAEAAAAGAATTAAPKATGAPASSLSLPYLQIGTFTQEANAKQAADALIKAGLSASVKSSTSGGKASWRVIVGPAATAAERNTIEKTVIGLGYKDAYPVAG